MGKKSTPAPPPAPDAAKTAQAQAAANKESAIASGQLNMVNQYTPYGSLEYQQRGTTAEGAPQYSAIQKLSPEQQKMLALTNQAGIQYGQTANQQLGAVSDRLSQPLDFSSLGAAPQVNEETRRAAAESITQRSQPQFDRDRQALETRLANQGIGYGSEAYAAAMDDYNRSLNDFRLAADAQAGNEMARLFGLESTARNQGINEMVQQRQIPLNELAAMLTGSQVQGPQFVNAPQNQIDPADIMGATYGSANLANQAWQQQMQNAASNTQGLYGLGGSAAMAAALAFSDRRLKRDIMRIGTWANGLAVYAWRYVWGAPGIGFMADEVRKIHPHAVVRIGGYDAVDYAEAVR